MPSLQLFTTLVTLSFSLLAVSLTTDSPYRTTPGLTISTHTPESVSGTYYDPNTDKGIVFNSSSDHLHITTLTGDVLLDAGPELDGARTISIGGGRFIQHSEGDFAVSKSHNHLFESSNVHQLLPLLRNTPAETHTEMLSKSVANLIAKPEINLLKLTAEALGNQGITGIAYPSILPFHMTALRLSSHRRHSASAMTYMDHLRLRRSGCFNSCPPCKDMECLGLCGPGCQCWEWVCDDCCYHIGCHYHDLCCEKRPDSLACLLPLSFSCDKKYKCSDP